MQWCGTCHHHGHAPATTAVTGSYNRRQFNDAGDLMDRPWNDITTSNVWGRKNIRIGFDLNWNKPKILMWTWLMYSPPLPDINPIDSCAWSLLESYACSNVMLNIPFSWNESKSFKNGSVFQWRFLGKNRSCYICYWLLYEKIKCKMYNTILKACEFKHIVQIHRLGLILLQLSYQRELSPYTVIYLESSY